MGKLYRAAHMHFFCCSSHSVWQIVLYAEWPAACCTYLLDWIAGFHVLLYHHRGTFFLSVIWPHFQFQSELRTPSDGLQPIASYWKSAFVRLLRAGCKKLNLGLGAVIHAHHVGGGNAQWVSCCRRRRRSWGDFATVSCCAMVNVKLVLLGTKLQAYVKFIM